MKILKNSVQLMGHLGRDIELTNYETGNKKASVSLATSEYYKNNKGDLVKTTLWHNIIAWGKVAENMSASLTKGTHLALHGKLNYRSYETKGQTKYITEIIVDEFIKLDKQDKEDNTIAEA